MKAVLTGAADPAALAREAGNLASFTREMGDPNQAHAMNANSPNPKDLDIAALAQALEQFTRATATMEEAYRRLEERVHSLDQELAEKNRELALTSDYLSNLLESASDGFIAVDAQGMITHFNRAAGAILGYTTE
jgi:PAS domain-containing protein